MDDRDTQDSPASSPQRKRKGIAPLVALLVVLVVIAVSGGVYLYSLHASAERELERQQELGTPDASETDAKAEPEPELPDNPIDFGALKAENSDVYAWISVPGTDVDFPVVQSTVDDNFYLRRGLDKEYSDYGTIFSQSMNATDFSDPVTVLYGHNSIDGMMFASLHRFEDKEFFDEHEDMYIYMPGHILTYRIIAAYRYDDRHILNSFDMSDTEVRREYFDSVLDPTSMVVNVREGATLDVDDKIVQLSTCPTEGSVSGNRYLVTGVLVDDQQTK